MFLLSTADTSATKSTFHQFSCSISIAPSPKREPFHQSAFPAARMKVISLSSPPFFFGSHIHEIESMRVRCIPRAAQCSVLRSGRRGGGGRELRNQFASMQVAAKSRKQGQACGSEKRRIGTLISDPQSCQRAGTAAPCGGFASPSNGRM